MGRDKALIIHTPTSAGVAQSMPSGLRETEHAGRVAEQPLERNGHEAPAKQDNRKRKVDAENRQVEQGPEKARRVPAQGRDANAVEDQSMRNGATSYPFADNAHARVSHHSTEKEAGDGNTKEAHQERWVEVCALSCPPAPARLMGVTACNLTHTAEEKALVKHALYGVDPEQVHSLSRSVRSPHVADRSLLRSWWSPNSAP